METAQLFDVHRQVHYKKPRMRGWAHLVFFEASLVLGTLLIGEANGARQISVASVYTATVSGLFGASALYHRGNWGPVAAARLQRLDQLMIFFLIAGTATPPMALCVPAPWSNIGLIALWSLTLLLVITRLIWLAVPERLGGAMFIGLGWIAGSALPSVWIHAGIAPGILMLAGGLMYTLGAVSYHRRSPDPLPSVFGYHEVFHTYVCAAAACQFVAIACFLF
ncbi:hemolysin III family protein [Jatrophihabitans sp.]|uniref:PAQR family membrane homeostasis protein TrhA n=1 Tax=Jatrophihabitans sp. TaxID=1932789 RepID=UPI0030C72EE3|nr:ADIPOR-like receptor [Jatrophihabitans sp.]